MKPIVSALNAWSCIVVCVFAIVILSTLGAMFASGHQSLMGTDEDPEDGGKVAVAVFGAVVVYAVFLLFCACQAVMHQRQSNRGAIALR